MMRPLLIVVLILSIVLLIVPAALVQWFPEDVGQVRQEALVELAPEPTKEAIPQLTIAVYRTASKTIEHVPLETYIRGVIASEMPAEFELEALKAQALAARTYIVRRLVERDFSDTPEGSVVTDTQKHQVFQNEEELRKRWGMNYEQKISRINQAINETMGQVLTYEGRPIDATFFSTSNGFTENSEDYWSQEIPYLRSVESPWDQQSPRYQERLEFSLQDLQKKLGVTLAVPAGKPSTIGQVISKTAGQRVKEIQLGEKVFTGKEVRELLDLPSAHFEWQWDGNRVLVTTFGWGHGVGMSQWGAQGMAEEGYTAKEIVQHYYQGIDVRDYRQWIVKK